MIMITGGAYQGKTRYASGRYGIGREYMADGKNCDISAVSSLRMIFNYHELVKRLGDECIGFTQELCRNSPEMIIVIDEIGCGIVPVEKSERVWRENVGRCGCIIAENSELVIRVVCGIPTVIKGDAR